MKEKVFKNNKKDECAVKYKYFSAPFLELYLSSKRNVVKNYILAPDSKKIL